MSERTQCGCALEKVIIGQEAICPDGLGRVVAVGTRLPHAYVRIDTYVKNRCCEWAPHNVRLIPIAGVDQQ